MKMCVPDERVLRFRATCYRSGKHEFTSMQAACEFGGELQQKFNWVVDLTRYDADVVISLDNGTVLIHLFIY